MRTAHHFHLKDLDAEHVAHWAHVPDDAPARTALATAGVMALLAVGALAAAWVGFEPWAPVLGGLFLISGIAELVDSASARETKRGWAIGIAGALPALLGLFLIFQLGHSHQTIALAVGIYFLIDGVARAAVGLIERYWRWGWDEVYAVVAILMGAVIAFSGGRIGASLLWFLVAAELVFRATSLVFRDFAFRRELAETARTRSP